MTPGLTPPFLAGFAKLHLDSTVESDPARQTWQMNSLRFPPKSRGGAQASIALLATPQGRIFSAGWRGNVDVRIEPGCGMYSLRFLISGDYRYSDGRNTFCSQRNLFIPPDQKFGGRFQDIQLLFVDLAPSVVERALGTAMPGGLGLQDIDSTSGKSLRSITFAAMREIERLPQDMHGRYVRNFQNLMAASLVGLLRKIRPDIRKPDPMIGRRKVADLREWAALDHEEPLTVGDLAARCGFSLRALQKNFLRHFDTTPHVYLRNLRLDKCRRLIKTGKFTVTEAALDAGFAHFRRFCTAYCEKFGELPSATLQETRRKMGAKPKNQETFVLLRRRARTSRTVSMEV